LGHGYSLVFFRREGGDWFGGAVGISDNVAIVGSDKNQDAGSDSGSAYLFDANSGSQLAKLTSSDATTGDRFGFSVAVSGSTAIVGAFRDDDLVGSDCL